MRLGNRPTRENKEQKSGHETDRHDVGGAMVSLSREAGGFL